MEKPGGPKARRGIETRKARSKLDLIKPAGGPQGGADGRQAQEMCALVPHVLREGNREMTALSAPSPLRGRDEPGSPSGVGSGGIRQSSACGSPLSLTLPRKGGGEGGAHSCN